MLKKITSYIFLIIGVTAAMDTQLFVYPSLSRCLFLETGVLALSAVCLGMYIHRKDCIEGSKLGIYIMLWITYIIFYSFFVHSGEWYRIAYLCLTLFSIIVLAYLQRRSLLTRQGIESVLLMVACIHILFVVGQKSNLIESGNANFSITGCDENPTVPALYLVGCVPLILIRIKSSCNKIFYCILLILLLLCVYLLRCRTAYIGLLVELTIFLVMIMMNSTLSFLKSYLLLPVVIIVTLFLIAMVGGTRLYQMKKDSADGRLLIWKLSARMIVDNPIGYGYGLFEKNYNLRQADYFASSVCSKTEKRNADFVYVPYNDYLEQGVEGGVLGMLFLLLFYAVMIVRTMRQNNTEELSVFCAFAVMSLFNFVYTSILPWFLVMCYASFVVVDEKIPYVAQRRVLRYSVPFLLIPVMATLFMMVVAQFRLKQLECKGSYVSDVEYEKIEKMAATSEAYWSRRAANHAKAKDYSEALMCISQARRYSSSPELFMAAYYCNMCLGKADAGIKYVDTLSFMLPQRLFAKHLLMEYSMRTGDNPKALYYANAILSTEVKVMSKEARMIIRDAKKIKMRYE